jgi:hypothetical protein
MIAAGPSPSQRALLGAAAAAAACVLLASFLGSLLATIGCVGSPTGRLESYCEESRGGHVSLVAAIVLLGFPALALLVGVAGVRMRRYLPAVLAAVILSPLAFCLPFAVY